eukprot:scaffold177161_cov29-Tisochrysis_lutea.AAC.3
MASAPRTEVVKLFVGQIPKTLEEDGVREGKSGRAHTHKHATRAPSTRGRRGGGGREREREENEREGR